MSFPQRLLTEGEEVVLDLRPHWKALLKPVLWTILIGSLTGLAFVKTGVSVQSALRLTEIALAFVAWIPLAGVPMVRRRFTQFVLTNERVITRTGVVAKHGREIPIEAINDVTFSQSIIERLVGAGDLVIESAGEQGQNRFSDVRDPEGVQLQIYRVAEARRGLPRSVGVSVADELEKLARLRDRGVLTPEEFEARKRILLES